MTDYARPEENTLGVILGKRNRGGVPAGSTAGRAMRQASARGASLGTGYLGIGASLLAVIQAVYGICMFVSHAGDYPNILPAALAWLVYALALTGVAATIATRGEQMPDWLFGTFLLGLAGAVAFDLMAIWSLHDVGRYATAAASVGFGLIAALTLRRTRELLAVASILGMTLLVAVLLTTKLTPENFPAQLLLTDGLHPVAVTGCTGTGAIRLIIPAAGTTLYALCHATVPQDRAIGVGPGACAEHGLGSAFRSRDARVRGARTA